MRYIKLFILSTIIYFSINTKICASPIDIKYYNDKQINYIINNKEIKTKYYGILVDEVALASATEVFSKSNLGIEYKYDSKVKKVTFSDGKNKLELKIDSNLGLFNGNSVYTPKQPRLVKFPGSKSKVYVPSRFVAQSFGLSYTWNEANSTVSIDGKLKARNYFIYNNKKYKLNTSISIKTDKKELAKGIFLGKTLMAPAKQVFQSVIEGMYEYNTKNKILKLGYDDKILTIKLGTSTADLNGKKVSLKKSPNFIKIGKNSSIYIPIHSIMSLFEIGIESEADSVRLIPKQFSDVEDVSYTEEIIETITNPDKTNNSEVKQDTKFPFTWTKENTVNNSIIFNNNQSILGTLDLNSNVSSLININATYSNTYEIFSTEGFQKIDGNLNGNLLDISLYGVVSNSLQNYGIINDFVNNISSVFYSDTLQTKLSFSLNENIKGYELSLSEDYKVLKVKFYRNLISEVSGTKNNNTYKLQIKSILPLEIDTVPRMDTTTVFNLSGIKDLIGNRNFISDIDAISSINYLSNEDNISLIINRDSSYSYYLKQDGNLLSIIFSENIPNNSIKIPLPTGTSIEDISDKDNYLSRNFQITIRGDYLNFFENNQIETNYSKISDYLVELDENNNTVLTFFTKSIYAYKMKIKDNNLVVDVDRADKLFKKVVIIDPGHGGKDPGALSPSKLYKEKNLVFSIGYTYFKNYISDDELKIYWTRQDDSFIELIDRANFSSLVGADLFISLHMNTATNKNARGTEVYYSTRNNNIQSNGLSSYVLAGIFLNNVVNTLKSQNRGVKSQSFVVVNMNTVPSILIEFGFLTNQLDLDKLKTLEMQDRLAETIYNSIEEVFDKYPTNR